MMLDPRDGTERRVGRPKRASLPRWLAATTRQSAESPASTLIWAAIVALICIVIGFKFLPLASSRAELIDPSAEFHKRWLAYTKEFGELSEIVVVVSGTDADVVAEAALATEAEMRANDELLDVLGEIDWAPLSERLYSSPTRRLFAN